MATVTTVLWKMSVSLKKNRMPNSQNFRRIFHKRIINQFLNVAGSISCYWQIFCGTTGQLVHFAPAFDLPSSFTVSDCIRSPAMESNHDTNYLSATNTAWLMLNWNQNIVFKYDKTSHSMFCALNFTMILYITRPTKRMGTLRPALSKNLLSYSWWD